MRGGEDRELSGRSNFLIDSAREKGGGGNFLMNLIRNSKEKGGGRTQSSGEQFPYCFSQEIVRKREEGGPRALGINFLMVLKKNLQGKGSVPGTIQGWI